MKKVFEQDGKHYEKEYDENGSAVSVREVDVTVSINEKVSEVVNNIKARVTTKKN